MTKISFTPLLTGPQGCQWVSKYPDDQTKFHSVKVECYDSAKIAETDKNHQNWTKIMKETLFSESFFYVTQFGLNLRASTNQLVPFEPSLFAH